MAYRIKSQLTEALRRKKISDTMKNAHIVRSKEFIEAVRKGNLGKKRSVATRQKISNGSSGHHRNLGSTRSDKTKRLMSDRKKEFYANGGVPWSKGLTGLQTHTTASKNAIAIAARKSHLRLWKDPEYVRKMMKAYGVKKNKAEQKLEQILNTLLPKQYDFVGDGAVIIGGRCPDFIATNGDKKIIELFGEYWHRNQDGSERIEYFKKYGYTTSIVWGRELNDENTLAEKIIQYQYA